VAYASTSASHKNTVAGNRVRSRQTKMGDQGIDPCSHSRLKRQAIWQGHDCSAAHHHLVCVSAALDACKYSSAEQFSINANPRIRDDPGHLDTRDKVRRNYLAHNEVNSADANSSDIDNDLSDTHRHWQCLDNLEFGLGAFRYNFSHDATLQKDTWVEVYFVY